MHGGGARESDEKVDQRLERGEKQASAQVFRGLKKNTREIMWKKSWGERPSNREKGGRYQPGEKRQGCPVNTERDGECSFFPG